MMALLSFIKCFNFSKILIITSLFLINSLVTPAYAAYPGMKGRIIFDSNISGNSEIYSMNPDGSNVIQLTHNSGSDVAGSWSANGEKIVFTSNRTGNFEIYIMDSTGETFLNPATQLTNNSANDSVPALSPDGLKIAFRSNRVTPINPAGKNQIWIMNVDGTNPIQLTTTFPDRGSSIPRFSPDGTKIIFESGNTSGSPLVYNIWVMNVDGSNLQMVTAPEIEGFYPDWSPDGLMISFSNRAIAVGDANIFTAKAPPNGPFTPITFADATQVTPDGTGSNRRSNFSPDSLQIAYDNEVCKVPPEVPVRTCTRNDEIFKGNLVGPLMATNLTNNGTTFNDEFANWQPLNYQFSGFMPPIDGLPAINVIKAGQAVPIKFSLNGFQGMGVLAAGYPKSVQVDCVTGAPQDAAVSTTTAGDSEFAYDTSSDTYSYIWKTDKSWVKGTCRQLIVKLAFAQYYPNYEGATYKANIKIK